MLGQAGPAGQEGRLGLLSAIGDCPGDDRLSRLLGALARVEDTSREWTERLAKAVTAQRTASLVPVLVRRLSLRDGRDATRAALVTFGRPAMEELWRVLQDPARDRNLRVHLPNSLARFGTRAAADLLLESVESEKDGMVRYKAIRGLGRLVSAQGILLNRLRVERLSHANIVEYFRLLALRAPFEHGPSEGRSAHDGCAPTERLLVGLLDDKLHQSLDRTFRLLKVAHPREDIHSVQIAGVSDDRLARANAAEYLDTLLRRRDQWPLRDLLRVVTDSLAAAERVRRARALVPLATPGTLDEALALLVRDADTTLAALATLHVATLAGKAALVGIPTSVRGRDLELTTRDRHDEAAELATHA